MKLADYNLTFVHIKDSNNILGDAISRLKTPDIQGPYSAKKAKW